MDFEYCAGKKIEIKYDKSKYNIKKIELRLNQLKRYLSIENHENVYHLVQLTLDNCSSFFKYYYEKCTIAKEDEILSVDMLKTIFYILDNILMYCYALESQEFIDHKENYIKSQRFLQDIYSAFSKENGVEMKVFIIPFKGEKSLNTEHYFYKFPRKDEKRLNLSVEELSSKYKFSSFCIVLDSQINIVDKNVFIPVALHEISHYIKLVERGKRNNKLKEIIFTKFSFELVGQLLSVNSNGYINSIQGKPKRILQQAIYECLIESFDEYVENSDIDINNIKFVDYSDIVKNYINDSFDFNSQYQVILSNSSSIEKNIKSQILILQSYMSTSISSRYESLKNCKSEFWFLEKLFCTIFFDILFDKDMEYLSDVIDYDEPPKDENYDINIRYFKAINSLLAQKRSTNPVKLSHEMFELFANVLIDQLISSITDEITHNDSFSKPIKNKLVDFIQPDGKDAFSKLLSEFEDYLQDIFDEISREKNKEAYYTLCHRIVEIKQHLISLELLISSLEEEKVLSLEKYNKNYVAELCYFKLRTVIQSIIEKKNNDFLFLMTSDLKNLFFKLGLFSNKETDINVFVNGFNDTIKQVGKKELYRYVDDQIAVYKESFSDLLMCWILNLNSSAYGKFFDIYNSCEKIFYPNPSLGNNFSKQRTQIVANTLNNNIVFDYEMIIKHFIELRLIWDDKFSKEITQICKNNNELMPVFDEEVK